MSLRTGVSTLTMLLLAACNNGGGNSAAGNAPAADGSVKVVAQDVRVGGANVAEAAPDLAGARRMIDAVYAPYTRDQTSDYFRYFTPELNAAIDRAGEGAVNADPLCDCQDFTNFTYRVASLEPEAGGAVARVAITNFGQAKTIILHLVRRGADWRIADVGDGAGSFAASLRR